jgi:hypothetical protein
VAFRKKQANEVQVGERLIVMTGRDKFLAPIVRRIVPVPFDYIRFEFDRPSAVASQTERFNHTVTVDA